MGFWGLGISALRANSIAVTPQERMVLEKGGEVLIVRGLVSPWLLTDSEYNGVVDQHGEQVYIPQLMHAWPPMEVRPGTGGLPLNRWLDKTKGTNWRIWPSYVGAIVERSVDQQTNADGVDWVRLWDGVPIIDGIPRPRSGKFWPEVPDRGLAEDLFAAAWHRVNSSVYDEFCIVADFENNDEYGLDDMAPVLDGSSSVFEHAAKLNVDVDRLVPVVKAYETLLLGGYLTRDPALYAKLRDIEFAPMEDYLVGNPAAQYLWSHLINRRENTLAILTNAQGKDRADEFDHMERKYV